MVSIKGIGCVNALGNDIEKIWEALDSEELQSDFDCKYPFVSYMKGSEKRRASRQSDLTLYTVEKAKEDYFKKSEKTFLDNKVGTIFGTDFGSVDVNLQFGEQVCDGNPELCSPSLFANTVANAPLTNVCIKNNLQGVSTMMLDSNEVAYSFDLISEEKANDIFCGFIAEYNKDLFDSYKKYYGKSRYSEATTTFLMGKKQEGEEYYCDVLDVEEANLNCDPWNSSDVEEHKSIVTDIIWEAITTCIKKANVNSIDAYFLCGDTGELKNAEKEALGRIGSQLNLVNGVQKLCGDTGSASFDVNMMMASICLQHNIIPKALGAKQYAGVKTALVAGISRTGNYYVAVLSR